MFNNIKHHSSKKNIPDFNICDLIYRIYFIYFLNYILCYPFSEIWLKSTYISIFVKKPIPILNLPEIEKWKNY